MKKNPCPLCKSKEYRILYKSTLKKEDFRPDVIAKNLKNTLDDYRKHGQIVKCTNCMLVYVNPQEDIALLTQGYKQVVDEGYLETENYRKVLSKHHLQTVQKYIKHGRILDVGCFVGFFLELAREEGWKTYGIEPSKWAGEQAKKRKTKIIGEDIDSTKLKKNYFDIVTLWDVIEHLSHPHTTIANIHRVLKKGGIIALGTPNIESLFAKVLRSNCPFFIRMHVVFYSHSTLALLLKKHGFEIIGIHSYSRTFPVYYLLDRIQIENFLLTFFKRFLKNFKFIMNFRVTLPFRESFTMIARKK